MSYEYDSYYSSGKDERSNCDKWEHKECEKEFLGKSVTECKYFRVCKCRFYEPKREKEDCCPKYRQRCQYCGNYHD